MAVSANLRATPASSLDPDILEATYARSLSGDNAAFMVPFLFRAENQRMQRGNAMMEQQNGVNQVLSQLAQAELAREVNRDNQTFASNLAQHGFSPLSMPAVADQFAGPSAAAGEVNFQRGALARSLNPMMQAAEHGENAGWTLPVDQLTSIPMQRTAPLPLRTALARAQGQGNRLQFRNQIDATGNVVQTVTGNNIDAVQAGTDQVQGITPELRQGISQIQQSIRSSGANINAENYNRQTREHDIQFTDPRGVRKTIRIRPDGRAYAVGATGQLTPLN